MQKAMENNRGSAMARTPVEDLHSGLRHEYTIDAWVSSHISATYPARMHRNGEGADLALYHRSGLHTLLVKTSIRVYILSEWYTHTQTKMCLWKPISAYTSTETDTGARVDMS